MAKPDTIWWCKVHHYSGDNGTRCLWAALSERSLACRMVEHRLASLTALVVERNDIESLVTLLNDSGPNFRDPDLRRRWGRTRKRLRQALLDALDAASQSVPIGGE